MKFFLFGISLILFSCQGFAQASASTSQVVDANLIDVVDLTFLGTGTGSGGTVALAYTSPNDYANGINSSSQQISLVSTKSFNVTVKTATANFSYSGTATSNNTMPVSNTLHMKVVSNNTGGATSATFNNFSALSNINQNLISTGAGGSNQVFAIQYRGMPSFNYSGGIYSVNVIYTVTQI